jgi:WD40 repeat protein
VSLRGQFDFFPQNSRGHAAINVKEDSLIIDDVSQGVAVFKLSTTDRLRTLDVPLATRRLRSVAFHDGNSAIISGSDHGTVYVFDRRTGGVIDTINVGIKDWVQSVAVRSASTITRVTLTGPQTIERNGVPLIFIGRSGTNIVGKNDVMVWEKVSISPKEEKTRKGFREEALLILSLFSVLFVVENLLVSQFHQFRAILTLS